MDSDYGLILEKRLRFRNRRLVSFLIACGLLLSFVVIAVWPRYRWLDEIAKMVPMSKPDPTGGGIVEHHWLSGIRMDAWESPKWSPDGTRIGFVFRQMFWWMNVDK